VDGAQRMQVRQACRKAGAASGGILLLRVVYAWSPCGGG
jgi:hypothetical protein